MEIQVLDKLAQVRDFDQKLIHLLLEIKSMFLQGLLTHMKRLQLYLVSLTCQNKNLALYKSQPALKSIRYKCLTQINSTLLVIVQNRKGSRDHIAQMFIQHLNQHPHCHTALLSIVELVKQCPQFADNFLNLNLVFQLCWLFEFVSGKIIKAVLPSQNKKVAYMACNLQQYLIWLQEKGQLKPVLRYSKQFETQQDVIISTSNMPSSKIPALNLPLKKLDLKFHSTRKRDLSYNNSSLQTFRQQIIDSEDQLLKDPIQIERQPKQILQNLANDLGQAYFALDLSYLLQIKRKQKIPKKDDNINKSQPNQQIQNSILRTKGFEAIQQYLKLLELIANREYCNKQIVNPIWLPQLVRLLSDRLMKLPLNSNNCSPLQKSIFNLIDHVSILSENLHNSLLMIIHEKQKEKTPMQRRKIVYSDSMMNGQQLQRKRVWRGICSFFGIQAVDALRLSQHKSKSNAFLQKYKVVLGFQLESDLKAQSTYLKLTNSLKVLSNYLSLSTSRIIKCELLQAYVPQLILIKRMLLQLSMPFFNILNKQSHRTVPSKHITSNIMQEQFPTKKYIKKHQLTSNRNKQIRQPIVFLYPQLLPSLLSLLSNLFLQHSRQQVYLLVKLFVKCNHFLLLIKNYTANLDLSSQLLLQRIQCVLIFYTRALQMMAYYKRSGRYLITKNLLDSTIYLIKQKGLIIEILTKIQENIDFYKSLAQTCTRFLTVACQCIKINNPFLNEQTGSKLIKTIFLSFAKIYSKICIKQMSQRPSSNLTDYTALNLYLQIILSIITNRDRNLSKRIYQFKILEFFSRQISLQSNPIQQQQIDHINDMSPPPTIQRASIGLKLNIPILKLPKRQQISSVSSTVVIPSLKVPSHKFIANRKTRSIYHNTQMHIRIVLILLNLALDDIGRLDNIYCDQFPISSGKNNFLFSLQKHLNHPDNQYIINKLAIQAAHQRKDGSVLRLLKLMVFSLSNVDKYTRWNKIASGAYGVIYKAQYQGQIVAVKLMSLPKSQYDRCVIHDVYNEVHVLQNLRVSNTAVQLYQYGVSDSGYFLILKHYDTSLKQWCLSNQQNKKNLPQSLQIFRKVLQAVSRLHSLNIVHYDIKADNVLIKHDKQGIKVVLADFGQSKIIKNQKDQFDLRSRGTDCIKSPQMLSLAVHTKKQSQKYDRRKKVGTTKSSDVWSVGCLFYQQLTGQFLFNSSQWVKFYHRVTSPSQILIMPQDKINLLENTYLTDFLKFMLVRDFQHRPTIQAVAKRFDNVTALISRPLFPKPADPTPTQALQNLLIEYTESLQSIQRYDFQQQANCDYSPIWILQDLCYCQQQKFNSNSFIKCGITHVICQAAFLQKVGRFTYLALRTVKNDIQCPFRIVARVSDFIKQVVFYRGKVAFISGKNKVLTTTMLYFIILWFKLTTFQFRCILSNQFPGHKFQFPFSVFKKLSSLTLQIFSVADSYPQLQCACGLVTFILKRNYMQLKKGQIIACRCYGAKDNCTSGGCKGFIQFMQTRFGIKWDVVNWINLPNSAFIIGPFKAGKFKDALSIQTILNSCDGTQKILQSGGRSKSYVCKVCRVLMLRIDFESKINMVLNNELRKKPKGLLHQNKQGIGVMPQFQQLSAQNGIWGRPQKNS